jgi:hypothetical protein
MPGRQAATTPLADGAATKARLTCTKRHRAYLGPPLSAGPTFPECGTMSPSRSSQTRRPRPPRCRPREPNRPRQTSFVVPGCSAAPRAPKKARVQGRQGQSREHLNQIKSRRCRARLLRVLQSAQRREKPPNWRCGAKHANSPRVGRLHASAKPGDQGGRNPFDGPHASGVPHNCRLIQRYKGNTIPCTGIADKRERLFERHQPWRIPPNNIEILNRDGRHRPGCLRVIRPS